MFSRQAEPQGFSRRFSARVDYEAAAIEATETQVNMLQQSVAESNCTAIQRSRICILAAMYSSREGEKVCNGGDANA